MELFKDTNIDFLRVKWICIAASWVLILIGVVSIVAHGGLRLGIDFSGGTQIVLKFNSHPEPGKIEKILKPLNIGLEGVQRYDEPSKDEVLIRVKQQAREGRDITQEVFNALSRALGPGGPAGKIDVNVQGRDTLAAALQRADPDNVAGQPGEAAAAHYRAVGEAIVSHRSELGLYRTPANFAGIAGISPAVRAWLGQNTVIGPFTLFSSANVGPQVGHDLRSKAMWAIVLSTLAMLAYIAFRFDFKFGVGAIVAIMHDTIITIGILSLLNREFTLVVVAALLTLVGYSMNDTVVVYDRIRENMRRNQRLDQSDAFADRHELGPHVPRRSRALPSGRRGAQHVRPDTRHRHHRRHVFFDLRGFADRGDLERVAGQAPRRGRSRPRRREGVLRLQEIRQTIN
jgi:preprotein translocase subunit SecF